MRISARIVAVWRIDNETAFPPHAYGGSYHSYIWVNAPHSKEAGFVFVFALVYWWVFVLFYGVAWITYYDMTSQTWIGDTFYWIKSYIIR